MSEGAVFYDDGETKYRWQKAGIEYLIGMAELRENPGPLSDRVLRGPESYPESIASQQARAGYVD